DVALLQTRLSRWTVGNHVIDSVEDAVRNTEGRDTDRIVLQVRVLHPGYPPEWQVDCFGGLATVSRCGRAAHREPNVAVLFRKAPQLLGECDGVSEQPFNLLRFA